MKAGGGMALNFADVASLTCLLRLNFQQMQAIHLDFSAVYAQQIKLGVDVFMAKMML